MKKLKILILLLLPLLACCTRQEPVSIPTSDSSSASGSNYIPGEAVLLLSEEGADKLDLAGDSETFEALGVRSIERMFPDAGEFEARHRAAGLHRWYRVSYDPSVARTKAGQDLSTLPDVEAVVFEPKKERRAVFNDPHLYEQWHYINDGSRAANFVAGIDINVEPVWRNYTGGSRDVIVAVIDGGIQASHQDLPGVVLTAEEGSRNFVYGYNPEKLLSDEHGTHVAGTIAAVNNNGIGVCGVAGGLDGTGGVRVMACNIFGPRNYDSGDEAAALVWAADHGAVIANNSWGYVTDSEEEAAEVADYFNHSETPLRNAIDYFIQHAGTDADGNQTGPMKGGLVLFAAGNYGFMHDAPAEYEPVVAVGAFGPDGKMALYSSHGPWVDIIAPGGSDSNYAYQEFVFSTVPTNKYTYLSGTSMACPHAAGVAALIVSYFGGPGFTADMLKDALLGGAKTDVLDLQGRTVGGGKLDALGSFEFMDQSDNPGKDDIRFTTEYTGDWTMKSHETLDVRIRIAGNGKAKLPVTVDTDCPGVSANCSIGQVLLNIQALKANPGQYTATIRVGKVAEHVIPLTILPNNAPQLTRAIENTVVNAASAALMTLKLDDYFTDADGELLDYAVAVSGDPITTYTLSGDTLTLSAEGYGLETFSIQASDARKASCNATFQILGRNDYQDMDVFPNPVVSTLHVRPATERTATVELVNSAGAVVYSSTSVKMGPFSPLEIDMREMAGGTYTLFVNDVPFSVVKK